MTDYFAVNRANWDERAPAHAESPDYEVARFGEDPSFLSEVVRFDVPLLGDVAGLRGIHLQCHIGTDTVSLARLGARMTGLDFSGTSLQEARRIAQLAGADVDFVEASVYDAPHVLGAEPFDLVFTGIGALCWLPSVDRWADVVATLLKPGGRLFLREGHPMLWSLDDEYPERLSVRYAYFEGEPNVWDGGGTYVATDHEFEHTRTYDWNHGMGEILTALLEHGLQITGLVEHPSVPWEALPGQMVKGIPGFPQEWTLRAHPERLAASYTLQARKPSR